MYLECPLDAPEYYRFVLHLIGFSSIPINMLGIYLVIFHSVKNSNYKYCQLYLQIVTFVVEIYMSWIAPGYYFFPMIGGFNTNSFTAQFLPGHFNVVFYFFFFAFELPALVVCFQKRCDYVVEIDPSKKISKYFIYFMVGSVHTFPFVVSGLLYLSALPYDQQYEIIARDYPKCIHVLNIQGFAYYDYRDNLYFLSVGLIVFISILFYGTYMIFLSFYSMHILRKIRNNMSSSTFHQHNRAIIALTLQCFIPVLFVIVPINIIFIIIYNNYVELQELATDSMFSIAAHSTVSTIVMISCNLQYRQWLVQKLIVLIRLIKCSPFHSISTMPTSIFETSTQIRSSTVRR